MNYWDELEPNEDQQHWSAWRRGRPARTITMNNYLSASVFMLSAFVVAFVGLPI